MVRWIACVVLSVSCSSSSGVRPTAPVPDKAAQEKPADTSSQPAAPTEAPDRLAKIPELAQALQQAGSDQASSALAGFKKLLAENDGTKPDVLALVDLSGNVVAMYEVPTPVPKMWRATEAGKKTIFPALDRALASRTTTTDTVTDHGSQFRLEATTVVTGDRLLGAVVTLYKKQ